MRELLGSSQVTYEITAVKRDLFDSSEYNWDSEWTHLIEDRGNEYITFALYHNGIIEGLMSIRKEMNQSLEIYKLEVSTKNRYKNPSRKIKGIGTFLVSYACWLAHTVYKEESCSMVSLFSKKSSEKFYIRLGGIKVESIDDSYFLFTEDIVHKLALNIGGMEE